MISVTYCCLDASAASPGFAVVHGEIYRKNSEMREMIKECIKNFIGDRERVFNLSKLGYVMQTEALFDFAKKNCSMTAVLS